MSFRSNRSILLISFSLPCAMAILQVVTADWGLKLVNPYPMSDAALFHYSAWFKSTFAEHSYVGDIIAFSVYETLLSLFIAFFGHSNQAPFVLNGLLSGITCVFLTQTTRSLFSTKAAYTSTILYTFCTPILYFTGLTLKTNLVITLFSVCCFLLVQYSKRPSLPCAAALGLLTILASIDRIHILIVLPLLIGLMLNNAFKVSERRNALSHVAILIIIVLAAAQWSHQYGSEPRYVSNVGLNIYLGHTRPDNFLLKVQGVRNSLIGHRIDAKKVAEKTLGKSLNQAQVSQYWLAKTVYYIKQNPWQYLRHQRQKLHHIFADSASSVLGERPHVWHHKRLPLALTFVSFASLLALAFLGTISAAKKRQLRQHHGVLLVLATCYLISLMASIVIERYRLPVLIALIPFAAYGLTQLRELWLYSKGMLFVAIAIFTCSHVLAVTAPAGYLKSQKNLFTDKSKASSLLNQRHYQIRDDLDKGLTIEGCNRLLKSIRSIGYQFDYRKVRRNCNKLAN